MVKVLGETYTLDDQEDSTSKTISRLWIYQSRYRVEVAQVPAGCWALIEGVEGSLVKSGTITAEFGSDSVSIFRPLDFDTVAVMKVKQAMFLVMYLGYVFGDVSIGLPFRFSPFHCIPHPICCCPPPTFSCLRHQTPSPTFPRSPPSRSTLRSFQKCWKVCASSTRPTHC